MRFAALMPLARQKAHHGFTLIEVLVVLSIMGLFVGLAVTAIRPDERGILRLEAERLAQLLDVAADEARTSGKPIAWTSNGHEYRFLLYRPKSGWLDILDSGPLRPRTLPRGMIISAVRVNNIRTPAMRLELVPYGVIFSFAVELSYGAERLVIEGSPLGEIRLMSARQSVHGDVSTN